MIPSSSGLVWKLASADSSVVRADAREARRVIRKSFIGMSKSRPQSRKRKATEYWPGFDNPGQ